jgi:hypothetical protein
MAWSASGVRSGISPPSPPGIGAEAQCAAAFLCVAGGPGRPGRRNARHEKGKARERRALLHFA